MVLNVYLTSEWSKSKSYFVVAVLLNQITIILIQMMD